MSTRSQTWTVRVSGFPFTAAGQQLGTVHAATKLDAETKATARWPRTKLVVQQATGATEQLERAIAKLAHNQRRKERSGFPRRPRPMEDL